MVAQEPQRNSPTPRHTWLFSRPLMELPTSLVPRVVLGRRSILRRCRTSKTTATHDDVDRHDDAPTEQRRRRDTSDDTLVVHAGERRCAALVIGGGGGVVAAETTDSIATPIVTGTVHWFRDSADLVAFREGRCLRRRHSFEYGRYGNPTVKVLEDKISAMERAEATIVTSSGMNAIIATLLAVVSPGGHVVATTDCYSEARAFIRDRLPKMGIRSTFVDLDDMEALKSVLDHQGNLRDRSEPQTVHKMLELRVFLISNENMRMQVTMFYADSPTNPHLKCVDVRRVAELCHQRGALVCIDSTMASPINQKPLTLGADVVLHSVTKYIAGHHDVIAGCISGSEAIISRIRVWHHDLGGTISPNAAYMIIRGLKTMALRVQTQNRTALRMAQLLESHPKIERVNYPWLESSPWHGIARRQMTGAGGVISFEVASDMCGVMRFVDKLELPFIATSLGGCESLVQQPAIMSYWRSMVSSSKTHAGNPLVSQSISEKLGKSNHALWKVQVLAAVRGDKLEGHLTGRAKAPAANLRRAEGDIEVIVSNPEYEEWVAVDQQVLSYLLSSMIRDIQVAVCTTAATAWSMVEGMFSSMMRARSINTRLSLTTLKKGDMTVSTYVSKMHALADKLAVSGKIVDDDDLISYIIVGLEEDYEPVIQSIVGRPDKVTIGEVFAQFLSFEDRLLLRCVDEAQSSASSASRGRGQPRGRGGGGGNNRSPGSGNPSGVRGNPGGGVYNRPKCQLCYKRGYTVKDCWYRYDEDFVPDERFAGSATSYGIDTNWYLDIGTTDHVTGEANSA